MITVTPRQREVVEAIARSVQTRGVPPTVRELVVELGAGSTNTVSDHLKALKRKGVITWERGASRTIRIVAPEVIASSAAVDPLIEAARVALRAVGLESELAEVLASRGPGPYPLAEHPVISVLANLAHDLDDGLTCACCGVRLEPELPLCDYCAPSFTRYAGGEAFCDHHEADHPAPEVQR